MAIAMIIREDDGKLENILKGIEALTGASVEVGLTGGSAGMADLATLLENGSPINRMPGRPFFKAAIASDETQEALAEGFTQAMDAVMEGDLGGIQAGLETAGQGGADGIRAYIDQGNFAPNAPITISGGWMRNRVSGKPVYIRGKGSSKPLIDTGALYASFNYEVKGV